ncbi:MAG: head-tail adaptor protein [Bermanella sp.]
MIGTLDTYAEIQRPVITKNALNEVQNSWQLVEEVWLSKRLKTSSEGVADAQQNSKALYELKTHYIPNLKDDYRIVIEGEYFNIIGHDSPFRSRTIITAEHTSYDRRN